MKITFGNIQHILTLLTTTEWMSKYDPKISLQKLQDKLNHENDPKKKQILEKSIKNIEKNIDPNKPYILTLEHGGINTNEAQLLLANLHLLYDADPSYKKESQEALIKLLELNFDKLNSHEIYERTHNIRISNQYMPAYIPKDLVNSNLYDHIQPYIKIIASLYSYDDAMDIVDITQKTSTYFSNFDDVIRYLKTVDYTSKTSVLWSFQYNLPHGIQDNHIEFFQKLNGYVPIVGRDILELFGYIKDLETNIDFQALVNNKDNIKLLNGGTDPKKATKIQELIKQIKKQVIETVYYYEKSDLPQDVLQQTEKLAEISLDTKLDPQSFRKAIGFIKDGNLKTEDKIPDIHFEFKVDDIKYYFSKLPASDMRGFVLGKLSNSCQSIGDSAEKCVLDGMSKSTSGFYVITDTNGKIHAQSYVWLSEGTDSQGLVLDSFEYLGTEDARLFIPAINELHHAVNGNSKVGMYKVFVGTGGKTPKLNLDTLTRPKLLDQSTNLYPDSRLVYSIDTELFESNLIGSWQETSKVLQRYANFEALEMDNALLGVEKYYRTFQQEVPLDSNNNINGIVDLYKAYGIDKIITLHNKYPNLIHSWSKYYYFINDLEKHEGISKQFLLKLYERNEVSWEIFVSNGPSIIMMVREGIMSISDLLKIYEQNPRLIEVMIQNPYKTLEIAEQFNIRGESLIRLVTEYPEIYELLVKFGDYTTRFPDYGIGMDDLLSLYTQYPVLIDNIAEHIQEVDDLLHSGISLSTIKQIYSENPELGILMIKKHYVIRDLLKYGLSVTQITEILHTDHIIAKYMLYNKSKVLEQIGRADIGHEILMNISTDQLIQALKQDISFEEIKILVQNNDNMSRFSKMWNCMKKIGLKPNDQQVDLSCGSGRAKRAADSCLKEDEKFRYDPLEEQNMTPEQAKAHRYTEMVGLATTWESTKHQKHKKLQQAIKYYQNIGEVINEGQDNWSAREQKVLNRHHQYNQRIASKETSLLQEAHNDSDSWHNHKVKIYDNGKSSLLVFKASQHFKIYSADLDYQRLYRIENTSNEELKLFIDAFFMWKDGSSDHKLYTLSEDIPHKTLKQIHNTLHRSRKVQSDYKILETKKIHIEDISLDTIRDVFVLDDKPINIRQLTKEYFKVNQSKLILRVDKLHDILPYLTKQEQRALFNIIKKYNLDGSWQKGQVLDEHTSRAMDIYSKDVIKEIKEHDSINLEKLSELSWSSFGAIIKDQADIGDNLGSKVIDNTKSLHTSFSPKTVLKEVGTQGLFFLPSIIKAVNNNQYQGLVKTGGMIAGDAAVNKLVESLAKCLPAERAALLSKLPITSPIFKALTIYSIVELHQELNDLPADAPQREMIKHELLGQYATIGLMCAETLGIETGPAWFVLIGAQLIVEAWDTRAMYKLDVPFIEVLGISLGFEQDKLSSIMEERELVDISLASNQASKMGYVIVQVPKIDKIEWQNVQPSSIPQEVLDALESKIISQYCQHTCTATNGLYRLTKTQYYSSVSSYDSFFSESSFYIQDIPYIEPMKEWQIKKVSLSPAISKIKFGQYANDQVHHIESNNWFLDQVKHDNHTWVRVPQNLKSYMSDEIPGYGAGGGSRSSASIPVHYKRVGPTANISDPISRIETGHAALYINQQIIKQESHKLNHVHFSFDPRMGNITLDITQQGLINMDKVNSAYLASVGNVNYTSDKAYIFNTIVSQIPLHESVVYSEIHNNSDKGTLSIQSDSMRVMTVYLIQYNNPCIIQDNTNMTMIQLIPVQESSDQFKQYLVNGTMQDLNMGIWSNGHIAYDATIKMNSDKKYLSIELNGSLIRDELEIGAETLEIMNIQGQLVAHSTLKITPNTQSFNTTIRGNIIMNDGISTLTLKGLSRPENIMIFSKSTALDFIPSYVVKIGTMNNLLHHMPELSVSQDMGYVRNDMGADGKSILHTESVKFEFSTNGVHTRFDTPQHSIVSFEGTIDGKNAVLKSYNHIHAIDTLDGNGNALISEYTHYGPDTISISQSSYITRVFDYDKESRNIVISHSYLDHGNRTSIETYKTHGILNQGRVYEFTTPAGLTIAHYFPQDYPNITVNDIVYTVVKDKLGAIDGLNHVINGDNLLSIGTLDHNRANIYFSNTLENSAVVCKSNDIIIDDITLHNVALDTKIMFSDTTIPLDAIADTIHCNTNAYKRSKRDLQQDGVKADNLEVSAMTSSATMSGSWINDGVKAIQSLFNTLLYKSLPSDSNQYREYKEPMIEAELPNTYSKYFNTGSNTAQVLNDNKAYSKNDPNDIILDNCTIGAQFGRGYVDGGATCHLPDGHGKVMIFPIKPLDTCAVPMTEAHDNYQRNNCRAIEFNNQKSVYCEGEKISAIYTPVEASRLFDDIDSNLMIGRVVLHLIHKTWGWITETKVEENIVIINEDMQKQWTHGIEHINTLLHTIQKDLDLNADDQKVINYCNTILENIQTDIDKVIKHQESIPQTLIDIINNNIQDLKAELTIIERSYYFDAEDSVSKNNTNKTVNDSSRVYEDHVPCTDLPNNSMYISEDAIAFGHDELSDIQTRLVHNNTNIQVLNNIDINHCAEPHYSGLLLGNITI